MQLKTIEMSPIARSTLMRAYEAHERLQQQTDARRAVDAIAARLATRSILDTDERGAREFIRELRERGFEIRRISE